MNIRLFATIVLAGGTLASLAPAGLTAATPLRPAVQAAAPAVLVQYRDDREFRERYDHMPPELRERFDRLQYEIDDLHRRQDHEMREGDRRRAQEIGERIEQLRGEQGQLLAAGERPRYEGRGDEWRERYAGLDPRRRERFDGLQYEIDRLQQRADHEARDGDRPEYREIHERIADLRHEQARILGLD